MAVAAEAAGGGELAELVTDHGLGHEHGHVLAPVVHRQGVADKLREDGGAAGTGLDEPLLPRLGLLPDLVQEPRLAGRGLLCPTAPPPLPPPRPQVTLFVDSLRPPRQAPAGA